MNTAQSLSHHGREAARFDQEPGELHHRAGERGSVPFRSNRFFSVGSQWYFTTREGFDSGPYASRERAEQALNSYVHVAKQLIRR